MHQQCISLAFPKELPLFQPGSTPRTSSPPAPDHSPRPKRLCHSPDPMDDLPLSGTISQATPQGPLTLKWQEIMPMYKVLTRSHQEAFSQDSSLVNETREEYFWSHHPSFNHENTLDFTQVFWHMIKTADLCGSAICDITEAWLGQDELRQANYSLMALQKGLKFFRAVSPSKSLKVMGLMGIHEPDVLCCFNGVIHCPQCRKVGQNEGTIVNHLQTVHYKLGLMCDKYLGCLSITSEAICQHGQKSCLLSGEGGPDESSLLV